MKNNLKRIAILGASRGLGFALAQIFINETSETECFLVSRKINTLFPIATKNLMLEAKTQTSTLNNDPNGKQDKNDNYDQAILKLSNKIKSFNCDFSKINQLENLMNQLIAFAPTHLYYVAGGGPFGEFKNKQWKDHLWALHVNLLFPAELLHRILNFTDGFTNLQQILFVGSNIAENAPDPKSASYAMAKHGLRGLITSIQQENPKIDLRLFSPGYIDTAMLPPHALPRIDQKPIAAPHELAHILYKWSLDPQFRHQHLKL